MGLVCKRALKDGARLQKSLKRWGSFAKEPHIDRARLQKSPAQIGALFKCEKELTLKKGSYLGGGGKERAFLCHPPPNCYFSLF